MSDLYKLGLSLKQALLTGSPQVFEARRGAFFASEEK